MSSCWETVSCTILFITFVSRYRQAVRMLHSHQCQKQSNRLNGIGDCWGMRWGPTHPKTCSKGSCEQQDPARHSGGPCLVLDGLGSRLGSDKAPPRHPAWPDLKAWPPRRVWDSLGITLCSSSALGRGQRHLGGFVKTTG